MKYNFLALTLVLASSFSAINAQSNENKRPSNIYIGGSIGAMSVFNDGMNSPTLNINIKAGKYISPVWGIRAEVGGAWQSLEKQDFNYSDYCKKFVEFNLDATLSLTNLFMKYNKDRKFDIYMFAGPTLNVSSAVSTTQKSTQNIDITYPNIGSSNTDQTITGTVNKGEVNTNRVYSTDGTKARIGATAGIGIDYNLSNKWALSIESRFGVTPSIFGWGSDCRSAEATGRLTIGAKYTFGGKNLCNKPVEKIVEKVVEKEVIKEVPVDVVKEIIKEIPAKASSAIFFKIGKSNINAEGMVNIKLMAKIIKDNPSYKYKIAGFADKGTGSAELNQKLSEKRAQAVYDALVAEGVNPDQLEKVAMGGTDPMFEKAYLNRVVILGSK